MDGWVYRKQDGQTIVSRYSTPRNTKQSAGQKQTRVRFQAAQAYAAEMMADPLKRLVYQKLGADRKRPPNTMLVSNFLTPPIIKQVDTSGYHRRAGGMIRSGADCTRIEAGDAECDHGIWSYRATDNVPSGVLLTIEITARNRARAEAKQMVALG